MMIIYLCEPNRRINNDDSRNKLMNNLKLVKINVTI